MTQGSMNYIHITSAGGPEVLALQQTGIPEPGPDQVLIKVAAAGLNRMDILQRRGLYPPPPGASEIPGVEVAGTVVAVGTGCPDLNTGDRVCALLTGGGYAEYTLADASACLPIPAGLDEIQAAILPEALFTVWSNVFDMARLQAGETFLVHGGSSGIGTAAIQLAHAMGARVFATAGSEDKCEYCRKLGAELAINYHQQDFVAACKSATGDAGIDVILDMVGGEYLRRNIKIAANEARIVMIAAIGGNRAELDILPLMQKRVVLTGSTLRSRESGFKAEIADKLHRIVWPLLEQGAVRPVIYRTFPLAEAASAHALMETNQHCGKIVLVMP